MLRWLGVVLLVVALGWSMWPAADDPPVGVAPASAEPAAAAAPEATALAERRPAAGTEAAPEPASTAAGGVLRVHGQVVDGLGQPLPERTLRCELRDAAGAVGHTFTVTSGADGRFAGSAPSPTAVVTVVAAVAEPDAWARPAREVLSPGALETSPLRVVCFPRDAVLRGHVEDTAGRPIAGARVGVATLRGVEIGCDAAGAFELAVASSQRIVSLYAIAPGFAVATKEVPIAPAETKTVTLVLAAGAVLSGRVVDADGRAVAGAAVSTSWTQHAMHVATDADGRFELPGVEVHAARQMLTVVHPDHVPWRDYLVVSGSRHVEITLARGAVVEGDVRGADGAVAAATITLTSQRSGERTAHSDERGTFVVRGLAAGPHVVEVAARGHAKHVGTIDVAGSSPTRLTVVLTVARALAGIVVDVDGAPLVGVSVRALAQPPAAGGSPEPEPVPYASAVTDAAGRFRLEALPDGDVAVVVVRKGATLHRETVHTGGTACRLVAGGWLVLDGRAVDAVSGAPVQRCRVRFTRWARDAIVWPRDATEFTAADGYWSFDHHVEADTAYLVELEADGRGRQLEVVMGRRGGAATLRATARTFPLAPAVAMVGAVRATGGATVDGAALAAFATSDATRLAPVHVNATDAVSGPEGAFRLAAAPRFGAFVAVRRARAGSLHGPFTADAAAAEWRQDIQLR